LKNGVRDRRRGVQRLRKGRPRGVQSRVLRGGREGFEASRPRNGRRRVGGGCSNKTKWRDYVVWKMTWQKHKGGWTQTEEAGGGKRKQKGTELGCVGRETELNVVEKKNCWGWQ